MVPCTEVVREVMVKVRTEAPLRLTPPKAPGKRVKPRPKRRARAALDSPEGAARPERKASEPGGKTSGSPAGLLSRYGLAGLFGRYTGCGLFVGR